LALTNNISAYETSLIFIAKGCLLEQVEKAKVEPAKLVDLENGRSVEVMDKYEVERVRACVRACVCVCMYEGG